jgi:Domain of unknown function (DUF1902)/Acetyltransferase (GNAT) family
MSGVELPPEGIKIRRDPEEEEKNPRYVYYKMYLQGNEIGVANYRLFENQHPYWYIDEFVISEKDRQQGYSTYLLKYVIREMWSKLLLPIHIYPMSSPQMPKEQFIAWLVHRGFIEAPDNNTHQMFCILHPRIYKVEAFWDKEAEVWAATSDEIPGLATEADTLESLTQKLRIMVPELLQLNQATPLNLSNTISSIEVIGHLMELSKALEGLSWN